MLIQFQPTQGSHITSIAYDPETLSLLIEYPGQRIYRYHQVPGDILGDMQQAESTGKFIESFIKGSYSYEKLS